MQFLVGYRFTVINSSLASQRSLASSIQRLSHWGLDAYFYPQASVKMSPDGEQPPLLIEAPPKPSTSWNAVWSLVKYAIWVIPLVLVAIYVSSLHSEIGLIARENIVLKEENVVLKDAASVTPDPVATTVFSTYTSVSTSTTTLTVPNKWFFAGDSSVPSEPPEPTHLHWESIDDPPPVYTVTPSATPSPKSTVSKGNTYEKSKSLSPWSSGQLPSSKQMTEHLRWAIVQLWKVVLKVYHYPLDPP